MPPSIMTLPSPSFSPTHVVVSPPPGFPPLVVIVDLCPSVFSPPHYVSSRSPHVSSVMPISSALDTNPLPSSPPQQPCHSLATVIQAPSVELHLPIALRKGTRACTRHPISHFISCDRLFPSIHAFVFLVGSKSIP